MPEADTNETKTQETQVLERLIDDCYDMIGSITYFIDQLREAIVGIESDNFGIDEMGSIQVTLEEIRLDDTEFKQIFSHYLDE